MIVPDSQDMARDETSTGEAIDTVTTDGPAVEIGGSAGERSRLRTPLLVAGPAIVAVGVLAFYLHGGRYESTDDAQLQAGLTGVAADVSGKIVAIEVRENQFVHKGDVLFRIDPSTPAANLAAAEAALAAARADVGSQRADLDEAASDIPAAQARLKYAISEAARQKSLYEQGISSRAQADAAQLAVQTARDGVTAAQARAESKRAALGGDPSAPVDQRAAVRQAAAAVRTAQIAYNNTIVRAARDGVVTKVNQIQLGSYVSASRPVFTIAGTRFWVEANFKENQLRYMRVGQPATVKVDAYPDVGLKARIASFSPGTGNSFSLLPAENATGNWVKVVQRLPVEIELIDPPAGLPLHAGLSATVEVDTGHRRHLFGADTPPYDPAAGRNPPRS